MGRSYETEVTVNFEMSNGSELECSYSFVTYPGNYSGAWGDCYPDETECGEPTYTIDGDEVSCDALPTGLEAIATAMYDNGEFDKRFTYKETK